MLILSPSLSVLTCPLVLDIIKTNGFIFLSKYPIKYLELVFVLTDIEITTLSTLPSQIFISFLLHKTFLLLFLSFQISPLLYYRKNFCYYILAI